MAEAGSRLSSTFPQIDFERSDLDTALAVQPLDVPVLPESAAYLDADESEFKLNVKHKCDVKKFVIELDWPLAKW